MAKGVVQNVFPYSDGWAVSESWRPDTFLFFNAQEEALRYATERSTACETNVLLHSSTPTDVEPVTLLFMSDGSTAFALDGDS